MNYRQFLRGKKIVFYAAEVPPSFSGSGIMAHRFAKKLMEFAAEVKMVCFNYNNKLGSKAVIENVPIRRIRYYNRNILFKLFSLPGILYSYARETRSYNICFIYGAYMPGFEFLILRNRLWKTKTVFVSTLLHDDDLTTLLNAYPWPLRFLRKQILKQVNVYYAINEVFKETWENTFRNAVPIVLCTQGVDSGIFYPASDGQKLKFRKEFSFPPKSFIILSVGFLIERKGYRHIFKELSKLEIPFLYLVAGAKSPDIFHRSPNTELKEMNDLYDYGRELLGDKIMFLGSQRNMKTLYNCADIVLHGAEYEGTPNVVLEAMACKKPIIVKRLKGLNFLLKDNENVLLYNEPEELNNRIAKLYSDDKLAGHISKNAYRCAIKDHSLDKVAQQVLNV